MRPAPRSPTGATRQAAASTRRGCGTRHCGLVHSAPLSSAVLRSAEFHVIRMTVQLRCEDVNTLSYPPAALFALACPMVVFNVLGVVKARMAPRSRRGCRAMPCRTTCDRWCRAWTTSSSSRTGRCSTRSARRRWRNGCWSRPVWCRWRDMPRRLHEKQHPSPRPSEPAHDPKKPHVSLAKLLAAKGAKAP